MGELVLRRHADGSVSRIGEWPDDFQIDRQLLDQLLDERVATCSDWRDGARILHIDTVTFEKPDMNYAVFDGSGDMLTAYRFGHVPESVMEAAWGHGRWCSHA